MRILTLNLGNTTLLGAEFSGARRRALFRVPTEEAITASGFSRLVLPHISSHLDSVFCASVVPSANKEFLRRVERAAGFEPALLTATDRHGLKIDYDDPRQLGADRLAAALGARALYPDSNVIIIDCGTATTLTALRADRLLAGGAILPGLGLWAEALATRTAQLPRVSARCPRCALGRSPAEAIASGLYHGHLGALMHLTQAVALEAFGATSPYIVLGTGGGAALFRNEKLFTRLVPDLVLRGLHAFARTQVIFPWG